MGQRGLSLIELAFVLLSRGGMIEYDAEAERIARAERELLRLKRAYEVKAPSDHGGCEYLPRPSHNRTEQACNRRDAEQAG